MGAEQSGCNLCGGKSFSIREKAEPPYLVLECGNCGLVFVDPQPEPSALAAHYDGEYYGEWTGAQRERRLGMWGRRLDSLERARPRGRLLDVGCADGAFLALARERGWEIAGTEYSAYAAAYASKALGTEIFRGDLAAAHYPDGAFDVVTMWHVLEHMPDPKACLKEARRILAPGGLLVLAVPNVNDYLMQAAYLLARFRRARLFSVKDREVHLYHFSPGTIKALLGTAGFACRRLGPDNGIIQPVKRLVNAAAALPYYLFGAGIYNAIEVYAVAEGGGR